MNKRLQLSLASAQNEKDVEGAYRSQITSVKHGKLTSPYRCDGLFTMLGSNVRMLMEFKHNCNLKNSLHQAQVLVQCLFYLKAFEKAGEPLPTTILVGDINECFVIHTNDVIKYLSWENVDWSIAPSEAYGKFPELVMAINSDEEIHPLVFDVNESGFDFTESVIERVKSLTSEVNHRIRITPLNIVTVFDHFNSRVLKNNVTLSSNEKANLFIQILVNQTENYVHPAKKGQLVTKSYGNIPVVASESKSFFSHFNASDYSPREKEALTALVDRLVEESVRRAKGEYFTPPLFVHEAHKSLDVAFGADWKENYVVWDPACGTANLTRDFHFCNLYLSTIEQSDINTIEQVGYNPEAKAKFQFDFLNDSVDKLPEGLRVALDEGRVIFLMNPPYAAGTGRTESQIKAGTSNTDIRTKMSAEGYGKSVNNLYTQFMYRVQTFKPAGLALFAPSLYLTGGSFKPFRKLWSQDFDFFGGFVFSSKHFSDTAGSWPVLFSTWKKTNDSQKTLSNNHSVEQLDVDGTGLAIDGFRPWKNLNNLDRSIPASKWIREEVKGLKTQDAPQLSSACQVKQDGRGSLVEGALGYMVNNADTCYYNGTMVCLFSSTFSAANGLSIIPANFLKCCTLFSARRSVRDTWLNHHDEYQAPDDHLMLTPAYKQFEADSVVHALFNTASQQSSLRNVQYKGASHTINNEFFWLSRNEMMDLANDCQFDDLYQDAKLNNPHNSTRYVHNLLLQGSTPLRDQLSPDALEILDIGTELLRKSMMFRKEMAETNPEFHLQAWDAGWAQVKRVVEPYFAEEYKAFRKKYNEFDERMCGQVYDLGFLHV